MKRRLLSRMGSPIIGRSIRANLAGLVLAAMGLCAGSADAAFYTAEATYASPTSPIVRNDLSFTDVSESDSKTSPLVTTLYHAPSSAAASSDTLSFHNMNFSASSGFAAGGEFTDGQLNMTVQAAAGRTLKSFVWDEGGDWNVTQYGPAGTNTVDVFPQNLIVTLFSTNHDATARTPLTLSGGQLFYSNGSHFQTSTSAPNTGLWDGSATINLETLFNTTGITKIAISYDNQLAAFSTSTGLASIAKKRVDVTFGLNPLAVPEPATMGLVFAGSLLLMRRRRQ